MPRINPVPVHRDKNGYWTHPEFNKLWAERFGEAEGLDDETWNSLLQELDLSICIIELEVSEGMDHPASQSYFVDQSYDISMWEPKLPNGHGWFLLSISDTSDGPAATWVRHTSQV